MTRASSATALLAISILLGVAPARRLHAQSGDRGTLVVLNKAAASADLIDIASGQTLATLPTGDGPHEIAISRDGRTAVGTDYGGRGPGGNSLTVIDVPARAVARTIDLGRHRRPHGIAFLPGDSLVVVTSEATNTVVVVRVADGAVVRTLPTGQGGSHMLALVADGTRLFTSNGRDQSVSEIDVVTGRHAETFSVPPRPEAITVTADGREVWVGSNEDGTISAVDTENGSVTEVADGFGWPYRILMTPDQDLVLIPDLRRHELRFFDRESRRQLAVLALDGTGPQGVTLSHDARTAFLVLSQRDQIAVIDLERRAVVRYLEAGPRPDGIAYSPLILTR